MQVAVTDALYVGCQLRKGLQCTYVTYVTTARGGAMRSEHDHASYTAYPRENTADALGGPAVVVLSAS